MISYLEANARQRIHTLLDASSFEEFLPPSLLVVSPHLAQLDTPASFDDGIVIGRGSLHGHKAVSYTHLTLPTNREV